MSPRGRRDLPLYIKYEQLPHFCNHCGIVGHSVESCRVVKSRKGEEEKVVKPTVKPTKLKPAEGEWICKGKSSKVDLVQEKEGLHSHNGFPALDGLEDEGVGLEVQSVVSSSPSDAHDEQMLDVMTKGDKDQAPLVTVANPTEGSISAHSSKVDKLEKAVMGLSSNSGSLTLAHASKATAQKGKNCAMVIFFRDYNLQNKPSHNRVRTSSPYDNSYVIT